jgi:trigger factor
VLGDVRRGKALALVMDRVRITDAAGNKLSLSELRDQPEPDQAD